MVIFGLSVSVIIDGSLYGRVLGFSSVDFIFLSYMEWTYIDVVRRRIICKIFQNCNFGEYSKMVIWGLRHIEKDNAYIVMLWRPTLRGRVCKENVVRISWERRCEKDGVRKTLWERRCEKDVVRKIVDVAEDLISFTDLLVYIETIRSSLILTRYNINPQH